VEQSGGVRQEVAEMKKKRWEGIGVVESDRKGWKGIGSGGER